MRVFWCYVYDAVVPSHLWETYVDISLNHFSVLFGSNVGVLVGTNIAALEASSMPA